MAKDLPFPRGVFVSWSLCEAGIYWVPFFPLTGRRSSLGVSCAGPRLTTGVNHSEAALRSSSAVSAGVLVTAKFYLFGALGKNSHVTKSRHTASISLSLICISAFLCGLFRGWFSQRAQRLICCQTRKERRRLRAVQALLLSWRRQMTRMEALVRARRQIHERRY